jgi:hypothetical protein
VKEEQVTDLPGGTPDYLASIGLGQPLIDRAYAHYRFMQRICPEPIEDIFVSEYTAEDGHREYESLWFASATYVMEAHQFVSGDTSDIVSLVGGISRLIFERQSYQFEAATDSSRLTVQVDFDFGARTGGVSGILKASGSNCEKLKEFVEAHFLPNFARRAVLTDR